MQGQMVQRARSNIGREVKFWLDGMWLERVLVEWAVQDVERELNVASPVGQVLVGALAGDEYVVQAPGGALQLRVLEVGDVIG